jgi:hypothetical protein
VAADAAKCSERVCKSENRDQYNDFLNILAEKFSENIGVFCSNYR